MDFGDLIYVIVFILASLFGTLGKKRKGRQTHRITQEPRPVFEGFLGQEKPAKSSFQPIYTSEPTGTHQSHDQHQPKEEISISDFSQKLREKRDDLSFNAPTEEVLQTPSMKVQHVGTRHPLLDDLRQRNEVQKAVIYSEIFKTKF